MKWAKFGRKSIDKATGQTDQYRRITAPPPAEPPRCKQTENRGQRQRRRTEKKERRKETGKKERG